MELYRVAWSFLSFFLFVTFAGSKDEVRGTQDVTAATRLEPSRSTSKDTKYVSCWNKKQAQTVSRLVRSPILTSSDGLHRAYVEVEAIAFQPKDAATYTGSLCENTSRLFLGGPGDADFKLAYSQSPDFSDGNSLKLVDWSPDGMHLLMERAIWKYESEGNYTDLVLFSLSSGGVAAPDLSKILEDRFGKGCGSQNSVIGFTPEGNVVVLVTPLEDTYYNEGATSCVKQKTLLALDAKHALQDIAQVLPGDFKARHYGQFPERQAQEESAQAKSLPPGVLRALASDEKDYCDKFLGDFKKGCSQTFQGHLLSRELVITPSGQAAILVENREACGSAGCSLSLFVEQPDAKFVQVLGRDGEVGTLGSVKVLKAVTNGHYNIQKTWHDGKTYTLYFWRRLRYTARVKSSESATSAAHSTLKQ